MNQTDRGDRSKQLLSKTDPMTHQFQASATAALAGGDTRRRNMAAKSCGIWMRPGGSEGANSGDWRVWTGGKIG